MAMGFGSLKRVRWGSWLGDLWLGCSYVLCKMMAAYSSTIAGHPGAAQQFPSPASAFRGRRSS
jgi:hypothetical protein